jgi:pimeloyl-ACP methyl ester carboxylesterase
MCNENEITPKDGRWAMRWPVLLIVLQIFFCTVGADAGESVITHANVIHGANGSTLVVLLHGYTLDYRSLESVQHTIEGAKEFQGCDFLIPDLPLGEFSMVPSSRITAGLLQALDSAWDIRAKEGRPYRRIVMVGHSVGGLYARKIYAAACGENDKAPFDEALKGELKGLRVAQLAKVRPWAPAVDRIVLLAGMNRGWTISHHMSLLNAVEMTIGTGIGHVLSWLYQRPPVIFTVRRGSSFITELRLQWLAMREQAISKRAGGATTVQLLGTVDDLVSPDDNIDLVTGKDFYYMEVPQSGHANVIKMAAEDGAAGIGRRKVLLDALGDLSKGQKEPGLVDEDELRPVRKDVTDVVFVIHGIRDEGHWTRKIAYHVRQLGVGHPMVIESETSTYGYFPMLSFLRPGARQEKVEWLMDRYAEARARYPNAKFHYVGHSNGTYLLAKALEEYPAVRFDRVVFAGSVVHRDYGWNKLIEGGRVQKVFNFIASHDWVVAFFPKAFQSVGIQDLGSAGHDGFLAASAQGPVQELPNRYIVGGHSAALQEGMWDAIAEYVLTGNFKMPPQVSVTDRRSRWVAWPAHVAPLLWVLVIGVICLGLRFLLRMEVREWKKTLAIVAYCDIIWIVLTKV